MSRDLLERCDRHIVDETQRHLVLEDVEQCVFELALERRGHIDDQPLEVRGRLTSQRGRDRGPSRDGVCHQERGHHT